MSEAQQLKSLIFDQRDLNYEEVTVDAWKDASGKPVKVLVWEMTADEFGEYQNALSHIKQEMDLRPGKKRGRHNDVKFIMESNIHRATVELVFRCLKDSNGVRIFTSDADKEALGSKGRTALDQIADAALRINKLESEDDEDENTPTEVTEGKG